MDFTDFKQYSKYILPANFRRRSRDSGTYHLWGLRPHSRSDRVLKQSAGCAAQGGGLPLGLCDYPIGWNVLFHRMSRSFWALWANSLAFGLCALVRF